MISWSYLALGFALLTVLLRGSEREPVRSLWMSWSKLFLALALLLVITLPVHFFLWDRMGRHDLGLIFLFLGAFLIDEKIHPFGRRRAGKGPARFFMSLSLPALLAFSLWTLSGASEGPQGFRIQHLVWGLGLPVGSGFFHWVLKGLEDRLRLSSIPPALEGEALLFWLMSLISLAFFGL